MFVNDSIEGLEHKEHVWESKGEWLVRKSQNFSSKFLHQFTLLQIMSFISVAVFCLCSVCIYCPITSLSLNIFIFINHTHPHTIRLEIRSLSLHVIGNLQRNSIRTYLGSFSIDYSETQEARTLCRVLWFFLLLSVWHSNSEQVHSAALDSIIGNSHWNPSWEFTIGIHPRNL